MNILCVCNQGLNRSKIAAKFLERKGHTTIYKGIGDDAPNPLTKKEWDWAEAVVFAREWHRKKANERFGEKEQEFVLEVTDDLQELPELWRRAKLMNPEQFYKEYTLPRIEEKLVSIYESLEQKL